MTNDHITFTTKAKKFFSFLIDPIVKFFDDIGIGPNFLTILGLLGTIFAAFFISIAKFQPAALLLILFGAMDGLDGALARYKNIESNYGAFLDSVLDRYSEFFIFAGFLYYFTQINNFEGILLSYASISFSLIVSYTRARSSDLSADIKRGLFTRLERYMVIIFMLLMEKPLLCVSIVAFFSLITGIQRFLIGRKKLKKDL